MQVLGEKPLLLNSPKIRVNASQIASIDNTIFSHAAVKFYVPVNLEKHLGGASAAAGGSCYGAVMTVYKENPFYSEMVRSFKYGFKVRDALVWWQVWWIAWAPAMPRPNCFYEGGGGVWGGRGGRDERKGREVRYWILTVTRFIKEYEWTWADWNGNQMKYWDLASTGEASPLNKRNAIRLLLLKPEKAGWSRPVLSVDINVPIYILNYRSWKKFSIKFRKKFCFYTLCVCSRKYAPFFPPLTLSCHWPLCCSLFFWLTIVITLLLPSRHSVERRLTWDILISL